MDARPSSYLPGRTDPAWIDDLIATLQQRPFTESEVGVAIVRRGRLVARTNADVLDAIDLDALVSGRRLPRQAIRQPSFDTWVRAAGPPVRSWIGTWADPSTIPRTTAHLAALHATTGPKVEPVLVFYAWRQSRDAPIHAVRGDHWTLADDFDIVDATSSPSAHLLGVTRWMLNHPEDVIESLQPVARLRDGALAGDRRTTRVFTSRGWAHSDTHRFSLADRHTVRVASWTRPMGTSLPKAIPLPYEALSARELEVFTFLRGGLASVSIANRLDLAPSTVRTMTARIMSKLRVRDREELRERYDPASSSAIETALLATRGFTEAVPAARAGEPRYVRFDGNRDEWVAGLARTVASPLFASSTVGVALISLERIVAANEAFTRGSAYPLDGFDLGLVDPHGERDEWRMRSAGARGAWSFILQRGNRVLTVSVVGRHAEERPVAFVYATDVTSPPAPVARVGWVLVDEEWKVHGIAAESGRVPIGTALEGAVMWPLIHPGRLPTLIEAFDAVVAGERDYIEIMHDSLRPGGWAPAQSCLRQVTTRTGRRLVLWEFGRTMDSTTVVPDPGLVASIPERDRALAIAALGGATVAAMSSEFDLAPGTVRNRLSAIYRRLGVHSQRELVERYGRWR